MPKINRIMTSLRNEGWIRSLKFLIRRSINKIIKKEMVFFWHNVNKKRIYSGNARFEVFSKKYNQDKIAQVLG